ncbi:MAG: glycosyltransferase family 2 protein [Sedimentisphaerales bacterium]|nr:glycosyltransferase family 2 protein [Sedimentisphaerales bacterium]
MTTLQNEIGLDRAAVAGAQPDPKASLMDISCIIVSWNARRHLLETLRSVAEATAGRRREIIVVDNASTDHSPQAVAERYPEVILIRNDENLGFSRANNLGLARSRGRYVALINSDVVVRPDCLTHLYDYMERHPEVGMLGPRILNPDGSLQVSCRHFPSVWNNLCQILGLNRLFSRSRRFSEPFMHYWPHDAVHDIDVLSGCFWFVRREALRQVGGLDERFFIYGEDIDWCRRFHEKGWKVRFLPEAQAVHYHEASSSNDPLRFYIEMQKADLQYWQKHHGSRGRAAYRLLILLRHALRLPVYGIRYVLCPARRGPTGYKLRRAWRCLRWLMQDRPAK